METPFGPLESLAGRTFELSGVRITVVAVDGFIVVADDGSGVRVWDKSEFAGFLSRAEEVAP
jgi:hypothetical protein